MSRLLLAALLLTACRPAQAIGPTGLEARRQLSTNRPAQFAANAAALSGTSKRQLVLWDLTTGEELAPPVHLHNPTIGGTTSAGLSLSDALIVSATCDGAVLWRIDDDALRRRACALAGRELTEHEQRRFLRASGRVLCPRE